MLEQKRRKLLKVQKERLRRNPTIYMRQKNYQPHRHADEHGNHTHHHARRADRASHVSRRKFKKQNKTTQKAFNRQ